ncbi:MAG: hypothetical protein ACKO9T_08585, partial [Nitrospira sp.]
MGTPVELGTGFIETFAGNGKARSTGDGKLAVKAGIPLPHHAALDRNGTFLYFAESGSDRVRRVDLNAGTLHNFAGIGETCYSGDSGPCGEAGLYLPLDVAFDSKNNLYICDSGSNRIRWVDRETGVITTVAGTGQPGYSGDGGPADKAQLKQPHSIQFDRAGNLFVCDIGNHVIRRIDARTGVISTFAGTGRAGDTPDGAPIAG